MPGHGNRGARILVLGESPGVKEEATDVDPRTWTGKEWCDVK